MKYHLLKPTERIDVYKPDYLAGLEHLKNNKKEIVINPNPAGTNNFRYFDGICAREVIAAQAASLPLSEANRLRLVKAAKSPTKQNSDEKPIFQRKVDQVFEPFPIKATPSMEGGAFTVIQFREWSDEYRIRTRIEASNCPPPIPEGHRESLSLTMKGAKKIADSCDYVSRKLGGYKTFLTLTFTDAQREGIKSGDITIQKEVSRFCDGMTKMYQRGWGDDHQGEAAKDDQLLYVWVAEVPDNKAGEPNPHVHMLLNWRVNYRVFETWADRVEKLWGCGFAHLEKIKDTTSAAAYMMKAAGYLCKSQGKDDQGEIKGNRYNMSKAARAPDWETVSETQLHIMGKLIADVSQHITEKHGAKFKRRRVLNAKMDKYKKGSALRLAAGRALEKVRKELAALPVVASQYQLILKGRQAFDKFMSWAQADHSINAGWLPDKGYGEAYQYRKTERPDTLWYKKFKEIHYWRRACRKVIGLCNDEWQNIFEYSEPYEVESFEPVWL